MKKETIEALIKAFTSLEKALFELSRDSRLFGESDTVRQARYAMAAARVELEKEAKPATPEPVPEPKTT